MAVSYLNKNVIIKIFYKLNADRQNIILTKKITLLKERIERMIYFYIIFKYFY